MKMKNLKTVSFDVHIPNLDGDGIAETIPIDVEVYTDPETEEDILTPESLELIEKTQARHMGLMSAEELCELREERLGLTQEEMSDLLQIGAKTYTRWESGRARPSRSMNVLLCALRDGQLDVNYLSSLRDPSVRAAWFSRETSRAFLTAFRTYLVQSRQPELKLSLSKAIKHGPSASWALWEHLWSGSGAVVHARGAGKSNFLTVLHEDFRSTPTEVEAWEPPSLPSGRQQRPIFVSDRTPITLLDDPVSG